MKKASLLSLLLWALVGFAQAGVEENPFIQSEQQQWEAQSAGDPGNPDLGEDPADAAPLDDYLPALSALGIGIAAWAIIKKQRSKETQEL